MILTRRRILTIRTILPAFVPTRAPRPARMSWVNDEAHSAHDVHYRRLLLPAPYPASGAKGPTPPGAFFVVGDQASTLPGWQEGAMMSAEHVVGLLTGAIRPDTIPERVDAPDTRLVTQGNG